MTWDESDLPDDPVERALVLMNLLIAKATGGNASASDYKLLRREFFENEETKALLPQYVRTCRDLDAFWPVAKGISPNWEGRRVAIRADFEPLLALLEGKVQHPLDEDASDVLTAFGADAVHSTWMKALRRRSTDPEGAITTARTLLEAVIKHILDAEGVAFAEPDDLPKLYRRVSEALNLAPNQHTEQVFRQILGSCASIVEGIGSVRNRIGDAHGAGPKAVRPSPRHAHLVVNLAGAMATFLVETWLERSGRR